MADNPYLDALLPEPPADPAQWGAYRAALDDIANGSPALKERARQKAAEPLPELPPIPEPRPTDTNPDGAQRA